MMKMHGGKGKEEEDRHLVRKSQRSGAYISLALNRLNKLFGSKLLDTY